MKQKIVALCGFAGSGKDSVADILVSRMNFSKHPFAGPLKKVTATLFGLTHDMVHTPAGKEAALTTHVFPFGSVDQFLSMVDDATAAVYGISRMEMESPEMRMRSMTMDGVAKTVGWVVTEARLNAMRHLVPLLWTSHRSWHLPPNLNTVSPRVLLQIMGTEMYRSIFPGTWTYAWRQEVSMVERVVVTDCRFDNEVEVIRQHGGKLIRVDSNHSWVTKNTAHVSERLFLKFDPDEVIQNNLGLPELDAETMGVFASLYPEDFMGSVGR